MSINALWIKHPYYRLLIFLCFLIRIRVVRTIAGNDFAQIPEKNFFYSYSFCPFSCTDHNVPLLSLRRDSPPKSSPTFSVQPRSSVGRVTVDLIRRSWVQFPPRSKEFFYLDRLVPWFPLLGLTPSGSFMGSTTLILLPNCWVIYHQFFWLT